MFFLFHFYTNICKDGWEYVDMLWCQGGQNIGLSNHELKSALTAPYDQNARPSKTGTVYLNLLCASVTKQHNLVVEPAQRQWRSSTLKVTVGVGLVKSNGSLLRGLWLWTVNWLSPAADCQETGIRSELTLLSRVCDHFTF